MGIYQYIIQIQLALRLSTGQAPIAEAIESSPKCRHNTWRFSVGENLPKNSWPKKQTAQKKSIFQVST